MTCRQKRGKATGGTLPMGEYGKFMAFVEVRDFRCGRCRTITTMMNAFNHSAQFLRDEGSDSYQISETARERIEGEYDI